MLARKRSCLYSRLTSRPCRSQQKPLNPPLYPQLPAIPLHRSQARQIAPYGPSHGECARSVTVQSVIPIIEGDISIGTSLPVQTIPCSGVVIRHLLFGNRTRGYKKVVVVLNMIGLYYAFFVIMLRRRTQAFNQPRETDVVPLEFSSASIGISCLMRVFRTVLRS